MSNEPQTKPDLLDEQAVEEIAKRPNVFLQNIPDRYVLLLPAERDALCQTVRALQASETYWQAEALLNHFCSEHASNKRQAGYYCTICAKPFVMSVPQGEQPPKYEDLIAENAALREQLAEAHKNVEDLSQTIFRSEQATRMRDKCVAKVKGLWTTDRGNDYNGALNDVLREIESLTLEQKQ